jgi:hypothetical protein
MSTENIDRGSYDRLTSRRSLAPRLHPLRALAAHRRRRRLDLLLLAVPIDSAPEAALLVRNAFLASRMVIAPNTSRVQVRAAIALMATFGTK